MAKTVLETVLYYKELEQMKPNSSILREVKWQYADMASGGDGGEMGLAGGVTCREYNYKGYPDSFFQEVCDLLMWDR